MSLIFWFVGALWMCWGVRAGDMNNAAFGGAVVALAMLIELRTMRQTIEDRGNGGD